MAKYTDADFEPAQPQAPVAPAPGGQGKYSDADFEAPAAKYTDDDLSTPGSKMQDYASEAYEKIGKSLHGVAAVLEPFQIPLRYMAKGVAKAARLDMDLENKPLSMYPSLKAPDITFGTIGDYLSSKAMSDDELIDSVMKAGGGPSTAAGVAALRKTAVFGLGMVADAFADPTMWIGFGEANAATRAAKQAGQDISKVERSTIAITKPFSGRVIEVGGKSLEATIPAVNKAVAQIPKTVKKLGGDMFHWASGDLELDAGSVMFGNAKQAIPQVTAREFAEPYRKANLSEAEKKVLLNVAEATPNLKPELVGIHRQEIQQPIEGFKAGNETTLYHGTGSNYENYDFSRSGGMKFYAEKPEHAQPYAVTNGGSQRQRGKKNSDFYLIDHSQSDKHGVVYAEKSPGHWGAVAIDADGGMPSTFQKLEPGHTYPDKTFDELRDIPEEHGEQWMLQQVPKDARVEAQSFSGLKILNTANDPKALEVVASLNPKTRLGKEFVEAAKRDLADPYSGGRGSNFGHSFWTRTKSSSVFKAELEADIIKPLKEMGYDGIRFLDDSHPSVAVFDPGKKAGLVKETISGKKPLTPEEIRVLGLEEGELRKAIEDHAPKAAAAEGVEIAPNRMQVINDMAFNIKRMNASAAVEQQAARRLDLNRPLNEQMIENYVAHVKSPEVQKALRTGKSVEQAADDVAKEADAVLNGSKLSSAQPFGKRRELRYDVREANRRLQNSEKMSGVLKDAGTDKFFIEDPYLASYINLVKKKKAKLDHEFIELLGEKGFTYVERDSLGNYVGRLEHDRARYPKGTPQGEWAELTAAKLNHFLAPDRGGLVRKSVEMYNRVFRGSALLLKPGFYLQNFADSIVKNVVQGVLPIDYLTASKAYYGKGMVTLNGKTMAATELRNLMEKYNVVNYGHSTEFVQGVIAMGKRANAEGISLGNTKTLLKSAVDRVSMVGSSGENWARASMFVNRLNRGYSVKQALYEVENFHFNFSRKTKAMDNLRLFFPFAQFPIKSAAIAGELVLKRPGVYNQQQYLMDRLEKTFNDPVEAATLRKLVPDYAKLSNPRPIGDAGYYLSKAGETIDNLLGANTWTAKAFLMYPNPDGAAQLPQHQVMVKLPIGAEALNQFALWESEVAKNGGFLSGPLWNAAMIMMTGEDPFTGASYDPNPKQADFAQRGKAAAASLVTSAAAFPNIWAIAKQQMGMANEKFTTPAALRLLQGALGGPNGFVEIHNADRSYMIKKVILKNQLKEQMALVKRLYARETIAGMANTSWMSGVPATTAREAFGELLKMRADIMGANIDVDAYLSRTKEAKANRYMESPELAKAIADMKGILKANRELDDNFVAVKNRLIEARTEEMKARGMSLKELNEMYKIRDEQEERNAEQPEPESDEPAPDGSEEELNDQPDEDSVEDLAE